MVRVPIIGILLASFCLVVAFGCDQPPNPWTVLYGDVTLEAMEITGARGSDNGRPIVRVDSNHFQRLPPMDLPEGPMPLNVKNFKLIRLSHFDSSVLNFLQKFHQHKNTLLANVNFEIVDNSPMETEQPILAQILPLISDNINSFQLLGDNDLMGYIRLLYNNQSNGNNDEFSELMTKVLAQTRILSIKYIFSLEFDWCFRWLYAPRMDGRPRMLNIYITKEGAVVFVDLIKKDFLMAKHPVTFFIVVQIFSTSLELEDISLENAETNENLLVVKKWRPLFHPLSFRSNTHPGPGTFLISRFPKAANGAKWIQANEQEILEFEYPSYYRTICLHTQD